MAKQKMAFLMHVDWNWIKQRPHFIYEELTSYYEVDLFFINKFWDRKDKIQNSRNVYSDSRVNKIRKIPLSGRLALLRYVEKLVNFKVIQMLDEYDYIWITSPLLVDFISVDKYADKIIIYDCMDDFLGFYKNTNRIDRLRSLEICLVKRSDIIFTSSFYLKEKMKLLYQMFLRNQPVVINNGISSKFVQKGYPQLLEKKAENCLPDLFNIIYIGTIESWIDFDLILDILNQIPHVTFTMIGPVKTSVPSHLRLKFIGAVKHEELVEYAQTANAFIMPFKLSELIRSVDPVKIYEYIHFGKPIFAINYNEMLKFLPFVNLYSNSQELISFIHQLIENNLQLYTSEQANAFLEKNTWELRATSIFQSINKLK